MHISDLHRSSQDSISNDELISALVHDRDRYMREDPSVIAPQAIVVSGDIIQGVPLYTDNFATKIQKQYEVAKDFLDELVKRFLQGDRSRLVMIPGNHDVDWNTAFTALASVSSDELPNDPEIALHAEGSLLRWDWKTLTMYRIKDPELYEQRLAPFWQFFKDFYDGVPELKSGKNPYDVRIFNLCDDRIGVAAYNSCHGNDCFAFQGMIRPEAIARNDLDLNDSKNIYDLRMAVWHHGIEGSPYRTDYMNVNIVHGLIGRGFRLGLHGHQHKSHVNAQEIRLPDQERMAVVSAGSLCASSYELPVGIPRQYNIIEIADDFCSVRTHVRSMSVANLFSKAHLPDFGGASFLT
ncbi:MAG: metallophosphoesterase [Bacteroidetes bacterium]|nr:metallophosphoesterase [Bacteroidota bacterium]